MTPFVKWIRNTAEKLFGKYEEGPDAPERLREMVIHFANHHPRASREDWVNFAAGLASEAYQSGYVRGYEYTERTNDWRSDIPPEELADWIDPNWKWSPGIVLDNAGGIVSEDGDTEESAMKREVDEVLIATARSR